MSTAPVDPLPGWAVEVSEVVRSDRSGVPDPESGEQADPDGHHALARNGDHDRASDVLRAALVSSPWRSVARTLALLSPELALEVHD